MDVDACALAMDCVGLLSARQPGTPTGHHRIEQHWLNMPAKCRQGIDCLQPKYLVGSAVDVTITIVVLRCVCSHCPAPRQQSKLSTRKPLACKPHTRLASCISLWLWLTRLLLLRCCCWTCRRCCHTRLQLVLLPSLSAAAGLPGMLL